MRFRKLHYFGMKQALGAGFRRCYEPFEVRSSREFPALPSLRRGIPQRLLVPISSAPASTNPRHRAPVRVGGNRSMSQYAGNNK